MFDLIYECYRFRIGNVLSDNRVFFLKDLKDSGNCVVFKNCNWYFRVLDLVK